MGEKNNHQNNSSGGSLKVGDHIKLRIIDINQEGQGIGRHQGMAVFVPSAIPGDDIEAIIDKTTSRYAVARLARMLTPSPDRADPLCPRAVDCGGCTLPSMTYPAQLRYKELQVIAALERIGHIANVPALTRPIIGMAEPWHYRSKVQFPIAGTAHKPLIGFYAPRTHQVIEAAACPIQPPVCDRIRDAVRQHIIDYSIEPYQESTHAGLLRHLVIRIGFFTGEIMVTLVINGEILPGWENLYQTLQKAIATAPEPNLPPLRLASFNLNINRARTNLILSDDCRLLAGQPWIEEIILGLRYRISPLAFFQVNPRQTERLYAAALELAGLTGRETVLDLYCGAGSITLQLARQAREAIGVEIVAPAIADARVNAALNGITNARFYVGAAESILPQLLAEGLVADVAVVDPPRKGCEGSLIQALTNLGPRRIVYVSCNPATLARDIALLQPTGYRVQAVQPVDMFPWTGHVETVVLMSKVEAGNA